ncbi:MAG: HAD family hydrolase [bacterium]|nr:HAD family hydrolase [bacterium]
MPNTYDTIVFDLDGTLLNTLEDLKNSVNHALSAFGCPARTLEEIRLAVGNGARTLLRRSVPASVDENKLEQIHSCFRAHYAEHCNDLTAPYDGILPMLDTLKNRGFRLAIVSNKPDTAVKKLCSLYFSKWISVSVGERENVRRKPAPDSVYAALRELADAESTSCGTPSPRTALYVGDSDVDIATAAAADMDCVSVAWGFRDEAFLRAHGASRIIHTPAELSELLPVPFSPDSL